MLWLLVRAFFSSLCPIFLIAIHPFTHSFISSPHSSPDPAVPLLPSHSLPRTNTLQAPTSARYHSRAGNDAMECPGWFPQNPHSSRFGFAESPSAPDVVPAPPRPVEARPLFGRFMWVLQARAPLRVHTSPCPPSRSLSSHSCDPEIW